MWKKSCLTSVFREFEKITKAFQEANETVLQYLGLKLGVREEYSIEYLAEMLEEFLRVTGVNSEEFVHGSGRRKTPIQKLYERIDDSRKKLKEYREKVDICGDKRNSFSKTDHDATFMRVKKDYMGNDQLLPAYNVQMGVCDGYIAVYGVYQYASDSDCFQPLIEEFKRRYHKYPKYPVHIFSRKVIHSLDKQEKADSLRFGKEPAIFLLGLFNSPFSSLFRWI